ncbi:MAG: DUF2442 domain-containing protein [Coriobacteriales bacterium]|jgi:hypothetical protein
MQEQREQQECSAQYIPSVVQAIAGPDRTVYAYFTDGSIHQFDMKPLIRKGGVFKRLEDDRFFSEALTVLNDTVAWDLSGMFDPRTCIDIDPVSVYASPAVRDPLDNDGAA